MLLSGNAPSPSEGKSPRHFSRLFSAALAWSTKGNLHTCHERVWWRYPSARAPATAKGQRHERRRQLLYQIQRRGPLLFSFSMLLFSFLWTGPFHHTALALAPYYQVHLLVCHKKKLIYMFKEE
jgi:hypothetical protein